jgi:Flp pilus assembly protein TadD
LGKFSQAVEAYQEANEIVPDGYEGHKGLTSVYLQLGRLEEALEEAKTARGLAPEEEKPALDDLIAQLEAEKK